MDFVTPAGRAEAAEIAGCLARALDELADAGSAAYALLISRDVLSPEAPQWQKVRALLATRPYLGDLRLLQEALSAIADDEAAVPDPAEARAPLANPDAPATTEDDDPFPFPGLA